MAVQIRYMGSKYDLAPTVLDATRSLPPGPFLDVFAGMCSVAGELASTGRPVWTNDVQSFATTIASALLRSRGSPPHPTDASLLLFEDYRSNVNALGDRFTQALIEEKAALRNYVPAPYSAVMASWPHVGNSLHLAREAETLRRSPATFPYRLTTLYFSHGYFGLQQAIELDSLRYAIDQAAKRRHLSPDSYRWTRVALLQAASHLASTPGHFAQYLAPDSLAAYRHIRKTRARSAWCQFLIELERLAPYGTADWRTINRVFNSDGIDLCRKMKRHSKRPAIVYADPPYSKDQYSRYYHVLETLHRYDYPDAVGAGRYRSDRFHTPFSVKSQVSRAFAALARAIASLDAILLLSYPSNGLLYKAQSTPETVLSQYFVNVETIHSVEKQHSTLGGAHGCASRSALERLILAKGARV